VTQEIIDAALMRAHAQDKPQYLYPNGIVFKESAHIDRRDATVPELLFVANFAPWHGLDVLLQAAAKSQANFMLHLVGTIPKGLKNLLQDPRIRVHGKLNHAQITELSEQCWIGLSSFALARKQMKQACPLKAREYWMLGLPVYGDYEEALPAPTPYYRQGMESMSEILRFAHEMRGASKEEVSSAMKPYIDKSALLAKLYQDLCHEAAL
jgi:glycosyltransferase involved in cell wall biosynthesis